MRTTTTTQLLNALKDSRNDGVWREFDARYRPIIQGFVLRLGLLPEDAADVTQQTLADFVRDFQLQKYVRDRGRLRPWIMGIAYHRAMDLLRGQGRRRESRGDSAIGQLAAERPPEDAWIMEEKRAICEAALKELREVSAMTELNLRAFELTAIRGLSPEAAAAELGVGVEHVYRARNRAKNRLGEIIARMQGEFDEAG